MRILDALRIGYEGFIQNGQYLMLYMAALLFLWLYKEVRNKRFLQYSFVLLLLLLCPVTAGLLLRYQTAFYSSSHLWTLLPMTAVIAYGLTIALEKTEAAGIGKNRKKIHEIFCTMLFAILLFLCGTLTPARAVTEETANGERLPREAGEVLELLTLSEEEIRLMAPDEIAQWARSYSGKILLPYGRNLWEPALSAYTYDDYTGDELELHEWINGYLYLPEEDAVYMEESFLSICSARGYEYLVFPIERAEKEPLSAALKGQQEYIPYAVTESYIIYRLEGN